MIDVDLLLRRVASQYGNERADELAQHVLDLAAEVGYAASCMVRREDLTPVVASAFLTVLCTTRAIDAERVGGPDVGRAQTFRLLADLAAADAWRCAAEWTPAATAGDGGTSW